MIVILDVHSPCTVSGLFDRQFARNLAAELAEPKRDSSTSERFDLVR